MFCPSFIPEGSRTLLAMRLSAENCAPDSSTLELRCEQDVDFDEVATLTGPEEKRSDTITVVRVANGCRLQLGVLPMGLGFFLELGLRVPAVAAAAATAASERQGVVVTGTLTPQMPLTEQLDVTPTVRCIAAEYGPPLTSVASIRRIGGRKRALPKSYAVHAQVISLSDMELAFVSHKLQLGEGVQLLSDPNHALYGEVIAPWQRLALGLCVRHGPELGPDLHLASLAATFTIRDGVRWAASSARGLAEAAEWLAGIGNRDSLRVVEGRVTLTVTAPVPSGPKQLDVGTGTRTSCTAMQVMVACPDRQYACVGAPAQVIFTITAPQGSSEGQTRRLLFALEKSGSWMISSQRAGAVTFENGSSTASVACMCHPLVAGHVELPSVRFFTHLGGEATSVKRVPCQIEREAPLYVPPPGKVTGLCLPDSTISARYLGPV